MRKIKHLCLFIQLIIILLASIASKAEYNLSIGHTETYRIERSFMDVYIDENHYSGDGFVFASNEFSCPQTVYVELVDYTSSSVYWKSVVDE